MSLSKKELTSLCQTATTAAIKAGQYIQSQVDKHYEKHHKSEQESLASKLVTDVDLRSQEIIISLQQNMILDCSQRKP